MSGDGLLWAETCSISSPVTRAINVIVHGGQILCLIGDVRAQRDEPHQKIYADSIFRVLFLDYSEGRG